ncbi:type VII secretion-associated serine protease mycosin [Nocardia sp. SYP-A9097]|uniref:type VII secretion-associated serine protease mycosin n=1 Tax=Nocardia sp. SYP-A9097 TaxID=2663237 RepID=UPI00129AC341|nr:type VII secretion-associated serine protease mycosin [Nocardia sp. SYP-A9097]MRH88660.1 type VII secretion-associated serine protease mycosin [Nocardia sp. SYP-A9097]
MRSLGGGWARILCATAVLGAALLSPQGVASAELAPPKIDTGALAQAQALSGKAAPPEVTEKQHFCAEPLMTGSSQKDEPLAQRVLNLPAAWQFTRGEGQKVAVIDTGVTRHPRLGAIEAGGDYVSADSDGTVDCDGHGTLVAGIIAARPSGDDAFVGVAPAADILAIRQNSEYYKAKDQNNGDQPGKMTSSGYGNMLTLAAAVVRAVDMGATVINLSEVACSSAGSDSADAAMGAAAKYAYDHDVVVVVAAGNVDSANGCATQNDGTGWSKVNTVASPAWFSPYVLTVASVNSDGNPSDFSLHGPWVGVAAVGTKIVSLDNKPGGTGLVNASSITEKGPQSINGTSFAAPYVAGLAALVRSYYPQMTAQEVMDRITRTAHGPGTGRDDRIGYGLIDPLAALTAQLPAQPIGVGADQPHAFPAPEKPAGPDALPRLVAIIGSIVCLAALGIGLALSIPFRRARRDDELPDLDS